MAQPTPYNPSALFEELITGIGGPSLDTEFDNIQRTTSETLANLKLIQRDDGALKNQSVTPDTLSAATLLLLASKTGTAAYTPRGAWVTGTSYALSDLVSYQGSSYVAAVAHVAGASFSADLAANKWLPLTSVLPSYTFSMGGSYLAGQTVAYSGFLYIARNDIASAMQNPSADSMNWILVGPFVPGGGTPGASVVFASDFGITADSTATTNGTDNAAAIDALILWLSTNPGATVIWPQDRKKVVGFTGYHLFIGCKNQTHIFGSPLRNIGSWNAGGATLVFGGSMFISYTAFGGTTELARILPSFINTVQAGSDTITLINSGDAALFYAGQWICVLSYDQQGGGFPPNYRNKDFRKIKSISGTTIKLDRPVNNTHSKDYYFYLSGDGTHIGPAGIIPLDRTGGVFCENLVIHNLEFQPNLADSPIDTIGGDNRYASGVLQITGCLTARLYNCKTNQFWTGESQSVIVDDIDVIECEPDKCQGDLIFNRGRINEINQATGIDYFEMNQTVMKYRLNSVAKRQVYNGVKFLLDSNTDYPIGYNAFLYQAEKVYNDCVFSWNQNKEVIQGGSPTEGPSAPYQPGILTLTVSNDIAPSSSQITCNYNTGSSGGDGRVRLEVGPGTRLIRASDGAMAIVTGDMEYVGAGGTDASGYFKIPIRGAKTFSNGDVLYYYPFRSIAFNHPVMLGSYQCPMLTGKRAADIYINDRDGYGKDIIDTVIRELPRGSGTNNLYEIDGYIESIKFDVLTAYSGVGDMRVSVGVYTPYGSTFPTQTIKTDMLGKRTVLEYNSGPVIQKSYSPSLTPADVSANTTAEQTFTVAGLLTTDTLINVIKPTAQAGLGIVGYRISAADTLAITFSNNTALAITPTAAQTYTVNTTRQVWVPVSGETITDMGTSNYVGLLNINPNAADNGPTNSTGWRGAIRIKARKRI